MSRVLAYDLGGSSLRVAVVEGVSVRRMVRIPQTIDRGPGGEFEADPNLWWSNFCTACRQLQAEGRRYAMLNREIVEEERPPMISLPEYRKRHGRN